MTEVSFYHLTRSTLEQTLPRLLEKALQGGARCVVMVGVHERVEPLSAHLWTYDPNAFLPHGTVRDGNAARQPVWLTDTDENPNNATMLFLTDGAQSEKMATYERCFELFDGRDESAVAKARQQWKAYRDAGHNVSYWQQTDRGGWEKKAG
ncbi:MAG: polymerase subunit chi [Alphaproteobacteria bacterium]|nr:polymerase subunit chi [Alphaproteobacteria bacterium]